INGRASTAPRRSLGENFVKSFHEKVVSPHHRFIDAPVHRPVIDAVPQYAFVLRFVSAEKRVSNKSVQDRKGGFAICRRLSLCAGDVLQLPQRSGGDRRGRTVERLVGNVWRAVVPERNAIVRRVFEKETRASLGGLKKVRIFCVD